MKAKQIFAVMSLFGGPALCAQGNHSPYIECYHTINDGYSDSRAKVAVSCASKKRTCYVLTPGEAKEFSIPKAISYSKKSLKVPETDALQDVDIYRVAWGPAPSERIELHFYKQMGGFFVKAASDALKDGQFTRVNTSPTAGKKAVEHFRKYINSNVALMRYNLDTESRPEDWTESRYRENSKKRLSGCQSFMGAEDAKLKMAIQELQERLKR